MRLWHCLKTSLRNSFSISVRYHWSDFYTDLQLHPVIACRYFVIIAIIIHSPEPFLLFNLVTKQMLANRFLHYPSIVWRHESTPRPQEGSYEDTWGNLNPATANFQPNFQSHEKWRCSRYTRQVGFSIFIFSSTIFLSFSKIHSNWNKNACNICQTLARYLFLSRKRGPWEW